MLVRLPCAPLPMPAPSVRFPPLTALVVFALLALLQSLMWIGLAAWLDRQCGWMALLPALTSAWLLRAGGMAPGAWRALWAGLLTLLTVAWANWGIVVLQVGVMMGVTPQESAGKLGAHLAWTLITLATTPLDWALMALAVIVAAVLAR